MLKSLWYLCGCWDDGVDNRCDADGIVLLMGFDADGVVVLMGLW